ncbi:helix-turn-helix domain-containing protein [Aerophototrophica crusticola]|uniref:Helix-turn-helix domain-containing protein n=1 Tax=Aerophototrophica crusticola TaxID=1709002 RepID=A0A858RBH3_9PROT|nr:helix-turn-helix domain-containing protein [Rhodospirillaceae bacterium B3]
MLDLERVGERIAERRRALGLTQPELARRAGVGRSTLAALEGGKLAELGFNKVALLLCALGLDLAVVTANHGRPTLEMLREEQARDAESLDR